MYKLNLTWIAILAICISFKASAQRGVPAMYAGDLNRVMNQNMMNMNMSRMLNQNWYRGLNYQLNYTYTFTVMMKDSTVKTVKSKLYADTALHKSYIVYKNKDAKKSDPSREQKIYADQTLSISREDNSLDKHETINGFATDSCWLFKVVTGKINAYSYLSEIYNLDESYLRAFQVENNKVTKLDSTALDPIIKTDPKAYKPFLKGKFYKAITKYNSDHK